MISRILIPIADEYFLEGIREFVSGLQGQDTELRLRLLHVVEPLGTFSVLSRKCLCRDGNELLDQVSAKLRVSFPDVRIEKVLLEGDAKKIILQEADDWSADLILLGPHTKRGSREFFLGRVANSILADPPCDVAVLHKRDNKSAERPSVA